MIRPMSPDETRALLEAARVGHLGCVAQGTPYVVPVSYMLDGETIYVHSFVGRKIRALRENPRACLQVEEIQDEYNWRSAIAFDVACALLALAALREGPREAPLPAR